MPHEAQSERLEAVAAHPLAELLNYPSENGDFLKDAAHCVEFNAGETVFRQDEECNGLYVVVSGEFLRRAERLKSRITLGTVHPGDLIELAAALGSGQHTYTLTAQLPGSLLLLPIQKLRQAFEHHPPLRMKLLEELAREVSRAYLRCPLSRAVQAGHF